MKKIASEIRYQVNIGLILNQNLHASPQVSPQVAPQVKMILRLSNTLYAIKRLAVIFSTSFNLFMK